VHARRAGPVAQMAHSSRVVDAGLGTEVRIIGCLSSLGSGIKKDVIRGKRNGLWLEVWFFVHLHVSAVLLSISLQKAGKNSRDSVLESKLAAELRIDSGESVLEREFAAELCVNGSAYRGDSSLDIFMQGVHPCCEVVEEHGVGVGVGVGVGGGGGGGAGALGPELSQLLRELVTAVKDQTNEIRSLRQAVEEMRK